MTRFAGKVCIVTGGASGIGARTAEAFAAQGGTVVIGDVNDDLGKQVAARIGKDAAAYVHLDVTDPAAPSFVANYDTPGRAYAVSVVGTLAYVADFDHGLQILDVSNPAAPTLLGNCDAPTSAQGVTVVGSLAYVADHNSGLQIVDVSDPSSPVIAGSVNTPGDARHVSFSDDLCSLPMVTKASR